MFNLRIKAHVEIATCLEPWLRLQPIASALSVKSLCTTTLTSAWELQRKNDSSGRNRRNRVTRSQEAKDKPSLSFVRSMACSSTRKEISPMWSLMIILVSRLKSNGERSRNSLTGLDFHVAETVLPFYLPRRYERLRPSDVCKKHATEWDLGGAGRKGEAKNARHQLSHVLSRVGIHPTVPTVPTVFALPGLFQAPHLHWDVWRWPGHRSDVLLVGWRDRNIFDQQWLLRQAQRVLQHYPQGLEHWKYLLGEFQHAQKSAIWVAFPGLQLSKASTIATYRSSRAKFPHFPQILRPELEPCDEALEDGELMCTGWTQPSKGKYAQLEGGEGGECGETGPLASTGPSTSKDLKGK